MKDNEEIELIKIVQSGDIDRLKILIEEGININTANQAQETLLHIACDCEGRNAQQMGRLLIENKADIYAKDIFGYLPLHVASLQDAMYPIVKWLIDKGVNIDSRCNDGYTPLHLACLARAPGIIALLIAEGADINLISGDGDTPLDLAQQEGAGAIISMIGSSEIIKQNIEGILAQKEVEYVQLDKECQDLFCLMFKVKLSKMTDKELSYFCENYQNTLDNSPLGEIKANLVEIINDAQLILASLLIEDIIGTGLIEIKDQESVIGEIKEDFILFDNEKN
jgi:ankyrin repeat protein